MNLYRCLHTRSGTGPPPPPPFPSRAVDLGASRAPRSLQLAAGEFQMDSKDCRDNATRCIEMANSAADLRSQSVLFNLARSWLKLAEELHDNVAFRIAVKDVDIFRPNPD